MRVSSYFAFQIFGAESKKEIIAGENTFLTDIKAVQLNHVDKKVYALNKHNDSYSIFSYFYSNGGNNAPARKLITNELIGASNFKIHNERKSFHLQDHLLLQYLQLQE